MDAPFEDNWWVLLVDNDEEDFLLTRTMLKQVEGKKIRLDWAANAFHAENLLANNQYTAVLVDYDLGERTGIDLIRDMVRRRYPAPLILFTGRVSHEVDLEAMQAGATLYLTKAEVSPLLLERFIRYAIERKRIEEELDHQLRERSDILESILDGFFAIDRNWRINYINRRAANYAGFRPEVLIGKDFWEAFPTLSGTVFEENYRQAMQERVYCQFEAQGVVNPSIWYKVSVYPSADGISIYLQDVTQHKLDDDALKRSEAIYRAMARSFPDGAIFLFDHHLCCLVADGEVLGRIGMSREDSEGKTPAEVLEEPLLGVIEDRLRRIFDGEIQAYESVFRGRVLLSQYVPLRDENEDIMAGMVLVQDITERKAAEEALGQSESKYRMLFNSMTNGFALHEVICNSEGCPVDYRFLEINPAFEKLTGLVGSEITGKTVREVIPGIEPEWIEIYGKVALSGEPVQFESYTAQLDRYYSVYAFSPRKNQFAVIFNDITPSKRVEVELNEYAARLKRSNQDLEDFAMIASHDLREPLRKVQVYSDILKGMSGTCAEPKAQETLNRIGQAVQRMQSMLDGLLAYSRVNTQGRPFRKVNLDDIARGVVEDLELRLERTGGEVEIGKLPVIEADPVQMRQLLQNLLGNALKFHREGVAPRVKVSVRPADGDMVCLVVEDNGIGFTQEAAGKIFQAFHRLNPRGVYEGSGMGLAICRKIAERHGGFIQAEGQPGVGATFYVNLPVRHV